MKKFLSGILIFILIISCFSFTTFAENEITVMINGEKLISDVPAQRLPVYDEQGGYVGDRVMLPIRAISQKLNLDVHWDAEDEGITLYRNNNLYLMWVNMDTAFHLDGLSLGKSYEMDVPPTIINSRTLVPVRAVAELLGATVKWIPETNTVDISYDLGTLENNDTVAQQCNIYQHVLKQSYKEYKEFANGTIETVTGKFVLESGDEIKFELYPELSPETCNNFIKLAKDKFYDGTIFHRVIEGFVAQGGGFDKNNNQKKADTVYGEFIFNGFLNLIPHKRGAISLARPEDFNAGSSQFFIVHKDAHSLDGYYAAFGYITDGMEIVDEICQVETDSNDKPIKSVVVKEVIID